LVLIGIRAIHVRTFESIAVLSGGIQGRSQMGHVPTYVPKDDTTPATELGVLSERET